MTLPAVPKPGLFGILYSFPLISEEYDVDPTFTAEGLTVFASGCFCLEGDTESTSRFCAV